VRLLFDLYHAAVMDESTAEVLEGRLDRVAHLQIADTPGRHEPGSGRIDWRAELGWIVGHGYRGRIGLEYTPTTATTEGSLGHIREVMAEVMPAV
jgi:hydroxypyruvate isomerase